MKVYHVTDKAFQEYGQVLEGYDFSELLNTLSKLPVPENGIVYQASVPALENCGIKEACQNNGFGGMPIQLGYVGGNNKILNCLEYHKSSEWNVALNDVILVIAKQTEIQDGKLDTACTKAFLLPAGVGVELYATTLHYAPMNVKEESYRVVCALPLGTNGAKPEMEIRSLEDKMCAGSNKWLMAHKDSQDAQNGAYVGLVGENISFDALE